MQCIMGSPLLPPNFVTEQNFDSNIQSFSEPLTPIRKRNKAAHLFEFLNIIFSKGPVNIKAISWVQHHSRHLWMFENIVNVCSSSVSLTTKCLLRFTDHKSCQRLRHRMSPQPALVHNVPDYGFKQGFRTSLRHFFRRTYGGLLISSCHSSGANLSTRVRYS